MPLVTTTHNKISCWGVKRWKILASKRPNMTRFCHGRPYKQIGFGKFEWSESAQLIWSVTYHQAYSDLSLAQQRARAEFTEAPHPLAVGPISYFGVMLYLLRHGNFEASGSPSVSQCQKHRCDSRDCIWIGHGELQACKDMDFLQIDSDLDHTISIRLGTQLDVRSMDTYLPSSQTSKTLSSPSPTCDSFHFSG